MSILKTYKKQIFELCEAHKVRHLYAFGSVLTSNFGEDSDVDLIVDFNDIDVKDYADNYFDFNDKLDDKWKSIILSNGLESICVTNLPGKNSTDIRLMLDMIREYYSNN
jgi:predicted nucleotidyltransferase